ncbi:MAG: hypothetical protein ACI9UA_002071 [Pseudoalteromonas tetraodonis]|jgi:uncharacterized protein YyaL (SSP411 family)
MLPTPMSFSISAIIPTTLCWILLSSSIVAKNHLAGESSPHLLEHANDLVNWYPWGDEAFQQARTEKKPLFISIGYHSCHWCHKMKLESFQDPAMAKLLNDHFINVKVDREELPDVDRIYMAYMQASQGSGGWPLNVWLTPDLVPFSVGTYFPPTSSSRQPAFEKVLSHIINQWKRFPDYIDSQSRRDLSKLRSKIQDLPAADPAKTGTSNEQLLAAYERLSTEFDPQHGGFGSAPRFPNPSKLSTAHLIISREKEGSFRASQCQKMINLSLSKMAAGSIHDHLGGGFHRYTSDPAWAIPHFEKMLTDQALLLDAYLEGYQSNGSADYLKVAKGIAAFTTSTLAAPGGAFYSSVHSDSSRSADSEELEEGIFYTWKADEFAQAAAGDAAILANYYGVRPEGNAPLGAGMLNGEDINVLRIDQSLTEVAAKFGLGEAAASAAIARGNAGLLAARNRRPAPPLNRQIVAASNGLMISALAKASITTGIGEYLDHAVAALSFIRDNCYDANSSPPLYRIFDPEGLSQAGSADDYAFIIQACLDLYTADLDERWLLFADDLQKAQNKYFFDKANGGFYNTSRSRADVLIRLKSYEDGAELAPNSSSILNLVRLGNLLANEEYLRMAKQSLGCFRGAIDRMPTLSSRILLANTMLDAAPIQVVVVGGREQKDTLELLAVAHHESVTGQILLLIDPSVLDNPLVARNPRLSNFKAIDGKATAYICRDFSCKAPTTDPTTMRAQITGSH